MSPQKFNKNLKITIKLCSCLHNEDLRIKGVNNMAEFLLVNGQINYLNLGYTKWRFLITMPLLVQPAESSVTRWEQWHLLQGTTYCTFLQKGVLMHRRIFEVFLWLRLWAHQAPQSPFKYILIRTSLISEPQEGVIVIIIEIAKK